MESMSALDAEFLHLEDDVTPYHIGGVAIFDGEQPSYEDLVELMEHKLHLIPRYRQRVGTVPLDLGRPVWVDDPHFSLQHHLFHTALPAPGDEAALTRLVGRLMGQRLDRSRPLWEIWLVERLADDRWALIFKVHHCMVDGIAGVALLGAVLDLDPAAPLPELVPWEPEPEPPGWARIADAWAGLARDLRGAVAGVPGALADPAGTARSLVEAASGLVGFGRSVVPGPPLSIEGPIGPHRTWARSTVSLAEVKEVGRAFGGTVNDVVLGCIARGMREILLAHDDDADAAVVRVMIPVSVRRDDGCGVPDNRVSTMFVELPVHLTDPLERLTAVREGMDRAKASHMAELGEQVTHALDLAPPMAMELGSRFLARAGNRVTQRSVASVATNVPGPQFPLWFRGREMQAYLPYVPIAGGVRVGSAILSYNGSVSFGITGDADHAPDVALVADGAAAELADLLELARAETAPPKRSRR